MTAAKVMQLHTPYHVILTSIQENFSRTHADLLKKDKLSYEDEFLLKRHIEAYLAENNYSCDGHSQTALAARIFNDMAGFSFLSVYLKPEVIAKVGIEEININSWDCIFLKTKDGKKRIKEQFISPTHAQDIIKRLLQKSNMTLDNKTPYALGHIGKNQRIGAFLSPILDSETGVSATIRIVSFSQLSKENLIQYKTATPEMLDFLELCLRHGISICIAGATGSGKTGTAGYLLGEVSKDDSYRVLTIEEGSREFDLVRRDEQGRVINDVIHTLTRSSDDAAANVTQNLLLEQILRHTPDILGIGEMRSTEAYTAIEASYTDHTILTTTHALSAQLAYERMVMLAAKGTSAYTEESLFRKAITAFPIIVYQKKMEDGSRRICEIFEGTGYEHGRVIGRTLYRYKIERTEYDGDKPIISGAFERGQAPSSALKDRLRDNGVPFAQLQHFFE